MDHFNYRDGELFGEEVPLIDLAERYGTPLYVYSRATLERHFRVFDGAFEGVPHLTCFAVKANSNLSVLELFSSLGGGMDVVSGGELYRALRAGVDPSRIVYAGVGKTPEEMQDALQAGILMFNVESLEELQRLNRVAHAVGKRAPVALRVNPAIDPKTHPYIATGLKESKFGIEADRVVESYRAARDMKFLDVIGLHSHIGSQITELGPFREAADRLGDLIAGVREIGVPLKYVDIGGGLGIPYDREEPPQPNEFAAAIMPALKAWECTVITEPGRVLVGNAGVLLTRVLFRKESGGKRFVVVDAGMNDLARPSLYGSHHEIVPLRETGGELRPADVVGPICESGDFLAKDRPLPPLEAGAFVAVRSAGAYGFTMSSNYNSRPRAAEVLVSGDSHELVRERETYEDLVRGERLPAAQTAAP